MTRPQLLVIEDNDEDYETFRRVLQKLSFNHPIHRCTNGDDGLSFLNQFVQPTSQNRLLQPKLILLDLNLPGISGQEVLDEIRHDEALKQIPVVVFTTSSNPKDIANCYRKGASGYIVKPIDLQLLVRSVEVMLAYWFEVIKLPPEN